MKLRHCEVARVQNAAPKKNKTSAAVAERLFGSKEHPCTTPIDSQSGPRVPGRPLRPRHTQSCHLSCPVLTCTLQTIRTTIQGKGDISSPSCRQNAAPTSICDELKPPDGQHRLGRVLAVWLVPARLPSGDLCRARHRQRCS